MLNARQPPASHIKIDNNIDMTEMKSDTKAIEVAILYFLFSALDKVVFSGDSKYLHTVCKGLLFFSLNHQLNHIASAVMTHRIDLPL